MTTIEWTEHEWRAVNAMTILTSQVVPARLHSSDVKSQRYTVIRWTTTRDVASLAGVSMRLARRVLNRLVSIGLLKASGISSKVYRVKIRKRRR